VWLDVGVINARVTKSTPEELTWLRDYLSFSNPKSRFNGGPSRISQLNEFNCAFPAGLVPMVVRAAASSSFTVDIFDRRTKPCERDSTADLSWLRDYQLEAVNRVVDRERGILWLPTASGKTEIFVGLVRALPCKWLFVVHRAQLAEQAAARYETRAREAGSPEVVGRIVEGNWCEGARVTVATFQTLVAAKKKGSKLLEKLRRDTQAICIDEAHVLPAATYGAIANSFTNAYYRVGLSGTPLARGDRRSALAIATLGPIIYKLRADVLVDAGVLAKPTIKMVECVVSQDDIVDGEKTGRKKTNWADAYGRHITKSKSRNARVIEAAVRAPKPAFLFVREIEHGKLLVSELAKRGLQVRFVWGAQETTERDSLVRDLVVGSLDVLVCSVVFQEGIDVPKLKSVIVASGGESVIATLQRIGRGMRVGRDEQGNTTKTTFEVVDFLDTGCGCEVAAKSLGTPGVGVHSACKWLPKHAKKRRAAYLKEGHELTHDQ